ncbi:ribose 5-phosphate isomerase B [Faecalibacter rhinopitheci]|uniref:Ribose 5-phosphate isomerase B n=1 Tax=Faecalibacter rhinopitheci TaxID=2779678 RepID=A0A8J7FXW5_9FLAO|nr:ribose 5-phosphate isomerase B [Faecalibacter rhinopitheci]MBF0597678.1 ribose 5-phosphate isomerase B [Faecalibacter rhinopitheci]MBQ0148789.1 ribose 5-phosphate isomerase B [Candidatus Onthonaster equi]
MKIVIGSDHAGYEYKAKLVTLLTGKGIEVEDIGPFSTDSVDYPDFAHAVSENVEQGKSDFGILLCGSAQGVTMTANKHQKVRAALCWMTDIAALARQHNNANVLTLPARFIAYEYAEQIVETFLSTEFEGGRHENRVNKIACSSC